MKKLSLPVAAAMLPLVLGACGPDKSSELGSEVKGVRACAEETLSAGFSRTHTVATALMLQTGDNPNVALDVGDNDPIVTGVPSDSDVRVFVERVAERAYARTVFTVDNGNGDPQEFGFGGEGDEPLEDCEDTGDFSDEEGVIVGETCVCNEKGEDCEQSGGKGGPDPDFDCEDVGGEFECHAWRKDGEDRTTCYTPAREK